MKGVEKVDFEKEAVAHMEAIEGDTFDQGDARDKISPAIVQVPSEADGKGVVDGEV